MGYRRVLVLIGFGILFGGCMPVQKNGLMVSQGRWDEMTPPLLERASFEMNCPKGSLTLRLLKTTVMMGGATPSTVGVMGCGQRAVYVWDPYRTQFVLNSQSPGGSKAATEPKPN